MSNVQKTATIANTQAKNKKPNLYKIVFLNDDFTTMEFVIHVVMKYFKKDNQTAVIFAQSVHSKGSDAIGDYSLDIAETMASEIMIEARTKEFPLMLKIQEV